MPFTYLAGDIGGTNARFHLYSVPVKGDEQLITKGNYKSQDFNSLTAVIIKFLSDEKISKIPDSACFSVAGPVKNGKVNLTNLGWNLSEKEMECELGIKKIVFLNDFASCGYGIQLLNDDELYELSNNKKPEKDGPKIIIGAGTGLGEAYIFGKDENSFVVPGEGGHTDFAPRNKVEFDLMLFIKHKLNLSRVGVERVISGPGLENIYWFYVSQQPKSENKEVSQLIRDHVHPGQIISKFAIDKEDVLCEKALKLFISCYGAETGNMALSVLPSGGIYVAGGIAPQLRDVIKSEFLENFFDKGRMRQMLANYPIYIVTNPSIGILGARWIARRNIIDDEKTLNRNLSFSDIQSMSSSGVNLLSETPKPFTIERKRAGSDALPPWNIREASETKFKCKPVEKSVVSNLVWMGAGVGLSVLMLGAFLFGKKSR